MSETKMKFFLLLCSLAFGSFAFGEADLELQSLKASPLENSSEMELTLRVVNHGPDPAVHFGCNIYVYSYQKLLSSQAFALKEIAPEESREEVLRIGTSNQPVTRMKAEIFDSQQPDTQPSSNYIQVNLKPPDYRNSDLEIVDATIETPQPIADKAILLKLKLRNNGPDIAPFTKLIADLQVFDSSVGKVEKRVDRVAAEDTMDLKLAIPLAKSISGGEGTIHLEWIGSDMQMFDPEKANHVRDLSVQLTRRMPDLIPKDIKLDKKGVLTFLIHNKGNAPSEISIVALFLNGALIQRYQIPALQPNANFRIKETSVEIESGNLVTVVADYNADVAEGSEENNKVNFQAK
jgi:hypothetical protein